MRILLAEDSRTTRLRLGALLQQWGHECVSVENGAEALEKFGQFRPHILVTDWLMPRMDGLELIRRLRDYCSKSGSYVYIILLTSRTETADIVEGLDVGADDFVKKPVNNGELGARIRAGCRIIELQRNLARKNQALVAANREITEVNRRMHRELESAAKIQSSFLPSRIPVTDHAKFAWHFEPCEELSGDTLNILPLDENRVGLYVVDVCGHGVSAALMSVHVSRLFMGEDTDSILKRNALSEDGGLEPPSRVASHLNELFPFDPASDEMQYFTMLYGILELEEHRFDYTSAGHPGPIIVPADRARSTTVLEAEPPGVGFFPDAHFSEKQLQLEEGDRLYLYTDGIFELMNEEGEPFGETRLADTLSGQRDLELEDGIQVTLERLREWKGGEHFEDDISLVGLEVA